MKHVFRLVTTLLLSGMVAISAKSVTAGEKQCLAGKEPCALASTNGERTYWVLPPDNWDGKSSLRPLLYFHGWGRQGNVPLNHAHVGQVTRKSGILLIAPDGLGRSWDFWRENSRDTDFALELIEDVSKSFPLLADQLMVSGYSWGGSMAWRFACDAGKHVSVLLSISGTLVSQGRPCETVPVEVRHVHGLKDTVIDFPYGTGGSVTGPVDFWVELNACEKDPETTTWQTTQVFERFRWSECRTGKPVLLDIHKGGHWIAKGWLEEQLTDLVAPGNKT